MFSNVLPLLPFAYQFLLVLLDTWSQKLKKRSRSHRGHIRSNRPFIVFWLFVNSCRFCWDWNLGFWFRIPTHWFSHAIALFKVVLFVAVIEGVYLIRSKFGLQTTETGGHGPKRSKLTLFIHANLDWVFIYGLLNLSYFPCISHYKRIKGATRCWSRSFIRRKLLLGPSCTAICLMKRKHWILIRELDSKLDHYGLLALASNLLCPRSVTNIDIIDIGKTLDTWTKVF